MIALWWFWRWTNPATIEPDVFVIGAEVTDRTPRITASVPALTPGAYPASVTVRARVPALAHTAIPQRLP